MLRSRPTRVVFFLALLIVLGAISSIGVALGDALLDKPPFARWNPLGWSKSKGYACREWNVAEYRGPASIALHRSKPRGQSERLIASAGHLPWWCPDLPSEVDESCEFAHGWPLPALRVSWLETQNEFETAGTALDKGLIVEQVRIPWVHDVPRGAGGGLYHPSSSYAALSSRSAIPLRPILPGLLIDAVTHSAIWFAVISMFGLPGRCRRWLRRRRGLCAACGYSLRGSPSTRCSECGWDVAHRRPYPSRQQFGMTLALVCAMTAGMVALILFIANRVIRPGEMHVAAARGDVKALHRLLASGHPVDARTPRTVSRTPWPENTTPLMWAAAHGRIEAMKMLIGAGADLNATHSWDNRTPLHVAVRQDRPEAVVLLLQSGAILPDDRLLPIATWATRPDLLRILVEWGDQRPYGPALNRALSTAAAAGRLHHLGYLLTLEYEERSDGLQSALYAAARGGRTLVVEHLLQHGARADSSADPLLWEASEHSDAELTRMLLDAGADPNIEHPVAQGWSPLRRAVIRSNEEIARMLVGAGADPHVSDREGESILFQIRWDIASDSLVELIMSWQINVNHQTVTGNTALMYAAFKGSERGVRRLLDAGADPTLRNAQGFTALDYAENDLTYSTGFVAFSAGAPNATIAAQLREAVASWSP